MLSINLRDMNWVNGYFFHLLLIQLYLKYYPADVRSGAFIVNFKQISHLALVFLLLTLSR